MARPDSTRKIQLFWLISDSPLCWCVRNTMPQAMATMTTVRTAVARFESTPSMPIFARIDVSAANTADPSANQNHITMPFSPLGDLLCHDLTVPVDDAAKLIHIRVPHVRKLLRCFFAAPPAPTVHKNGLTEVW